MDPRTNYEADEMAEESIEGVESLILDVMCASCSCGSSTQVSIDLDEDGRFYIDTECDNCGSRTAVAVYTGTLRKEAE